jgi:hypothetical protein
VRSSTTNDFELDAEVVKLEEEDEVDEELDGEEIEELREEDDETDEVEGTTTEDVVVTVV